MKTAILYNKELEKYSFGEGHPFGGERFSAFFSFFESKTNKFKDLFEIVEPQIASDAILELVHTKKYIDTIKTASTGTCLPDIFRYVSIDNIDPTTGSIPVGIDEASRIIVGSSVTAADIVMKGAYKKAIAFGGMHHAKPDFGEGFCFHNDVAICVRHLQKKYHLKRIFVLDTDAHAGNGTKEIFYEDPDVLFIDIHQDPRTIYPGSGFVEETGKGKGEGFTVNIPVPARTGNEAYQYLFETIVHPLADEFKPEAIIRNGGSDPYYLDSLADLALTLKGFLMIGKEMNYMTSALTQGKCIDLMLSGYNIKVLPFAWFSLIAGLLDIDIDVSNFKELSPPPTNAKLENVKEIASKVRSRLRPFWRCMDQ